MIGNMYDVTVIGGGVIGSAIARELSKYQMNICVLEKEEDVCSGTSKANSAIVHAGYDAMPGTLKAKLNVEGNAMMDQLSKDLEFDFKRNTSIVLCFSEEDRPNLVKLYERGVANGVPGVKILNGDEVRELEPNVSKTVVAALLAPTGGIVCPFGLTIALAENACENGVEFKFNTEVKNIAKTDEGFSVETNQGTIRSKYIVNAAGVYADVMHNMVSSKKLHIVPRRGEYCLLDKEAGKHVSATIFQLPGKYGKGILVTPTVHGNLLVGPTAVDQDDKENTATTAEGLAEACEKATLSVDGVPFRQVITSFSGLRAHEDGDEFIIGEAEDAPGFFDAAGIESPGLSSAPAIGVYLAEMIANKAVVSKKAEFKATRKGFVKAASLPVEERAELIKERPDYGTIICRCENISEGEIVDAINRPLGARSMDAIKRRVRQGMGRCQGGFCTPKAMEILSRETGIKMEEICKNRKGSELIKGEE
ncbi:MAG: NAD(P)/FAD-dependent oxidoreductase [Lachnospiraceae bacterium]|nr:NAD(P)/FAD-dependent oxidoreductase [Lachnospiraceae bacterium]